MIKRSTANNKTQTLESIIISIDDVAVALSGGIDSLVLSAAVHRVAKTYTLFHAVSAAVPEQATARVRDCASQFEWNLQIIDANELADPNYRDNPVDRCFYCKNALYGTISNATSAVILSGTNVDDLSEFRPGLKAAEKYRVRHPFVEAGIDKNTIRQLAHIYGLPQYSELPAAPCLASRVETGITIEPDELRSINAVERFIADKFPCKVVRCRLRAGHVVIELDESALAAISLALEASDLSAKIRAQLAGRFKSFPISLSQYKSGSAFLHAVNEYV